METQEYISSGIVESYVLGLASPEEMQEFENMCNQHPEVLEARTAFEIALEDQAMQNAVVPPASLKNKIAEEVIGKRESKLVAMHETGAPVIGTSWLKYAAAASVLLLAGSLYWNISLYNKNNQLQQDIASTQNQLSGIEDEIAKIRLNPNMKVAAMKGLEASPSSFATVYWDSTSHDVYLLVNNLPTPPSDKQYQLWAMINGKPSDLGVFDYKKERLLIQAKNVQGMQAFAITLEDKGGSSTPKGEMYVKGEL